MLFAQPVSAGIEGQLTDIANLAIQVSAAVLGLVVLILAVAAFFGIHEFRQVRHRSAELKEELRHVAETRVQIDERLQRLESDLEAMVLVAHFYQEGQAAYRRGDYDLAVSSLEEALAIQPDNPQVQVRLARALINKGQNGRADRILKSVIDRHPGNASAYLALATSRRYIDKAEAIRYVEEGLSIDGSSVDYWNYFGLLLVDEGRFEEALSAHQEACRLAPSDPLSNFFAALMYLKLKRKTEAGHAFYEAHTQADKQRYSERIRPIWADSIEWAYRRFLDTPQEEERALLIARRLTAECSTPRNMLTVLKHMIVLLESKGLDPHLDSSVSLFPRDLVDSILAQPVYNVQLGPGR